MVERGRFKVVIEAWLAAANDADLATKVGPVIAGFAEVVEPSRHDVLPDAEAVALFLTLREAILGLALGRATQGGPLPHERTVVDRLVEIARAHDARSTRQDALTGGTP